MRIHHGVEMGQVRRGQLGQAGAGALAGFAVGRGVACDLADELEVTLEAGVGALLEVGQERDGAGRASGVEAGGDERLEALAREVLGQARAIGDRGGGAAGGRAAQAGQAALGLAQVEVAAAKLVEHPGAGGLDIALEDAAAGGLVASGRARRGVGLGFACVRQYQLWRSGESARRGWHCR